MENHIFIYNEIGEFGVTAEEVRKEIESKPDAKNLIIHLSSPGGEVYEGWTIGNIIKNSGKNVTVIIEGICASIATYIALQADKIQMADTGRFMIHNPMVGVQGEQKDLEGAVKQLESIKNDLIKAYTKKTGKSEDDLSKLMDSETWFTSEQAKENGFVDEIIEPTKAVAKWNKKHTLEMPKEETKLEKLYAKMMGALDKITAVGEEEEEVENTALVLEDGTAIWVDSEDGELEGKAAFVADAEGNPTEEAVSAGTHALQDGRSITISEDGLVESVQEAEPTEEVADLQNKIAELESQLAASNEVNTELTDKNKALDLKVEKFTEDMKAVKSQIEEYKNTVLGEIGEVPKGIVKPEDGEPKAAHPMDSTANWLKAQNRS